MTESYGAFAWAYDQALGRRFFNAVRKLLDDALERYPSAVKTHLDVACGTGIAVRYFADRGWQSVGVDASLPMLAVARGRMARVVAGDFRAIPLRGTFARVTSLYDSLNHIKDRSELVAVFRAVARSMNGDSLFFFDMNHPEIYPEVWGTSEPFTASGEGYHLEIDTSYRKREALGRALVTGWADLAGGRVKIREVHEQRAWSERDITRSLGDAGLQVVDVIGFDPFHELDSLVAEGVKMFFVCRKTGARQQSIMKEEHS